jgi:hypothetical protein
MASNVDTTASLGKIQTAPLVFFRVNPVLCHLLQVGKMLISPCVLSFLSSKDPQVNSTSSLQKEGHRLGNYFLTYQILRSIND